MAVILLAACQPTVDPKVSDEDIVSALKLNAVNFQDAILTQNLEEFNKYVDQNTPFTTDLYLLKILRGLDTLKEQRSSLKLFAFTL